jgi:hypothetical protein
VMSGLRPEVIAQLTPTASRIVEISPGRYSIELALDHPPERVLAELTATGASLVSVNPVHDTLEDFFVKRVAEVGSARPSTIGNPRASD